MARLADIIIPTLEERPLQLSQLINKIDVKLHLKGDSIPTEKIIEKIKRLTG